MALKPSLIITTLTILIQHGGAIFKFERHTEHIFEGNIYTLVTKPLVVWDEAYLACKDHGLTLSSARTQQEYNFFKELSVKEGVGEGKDTWSLWFAGRREGDRYYWTEDNTTILKLDQGGYLWYPGSDIDGSPPEPNGQEGQNCVTLWYDKDVDNTPSVEKFGGDDNNCTMTYGFICRTHVPPDEPPFSCQGKLCGKYEDPVDCAGYYFCGDDKDVVQHKLCPEGLVFNPQSRNCDRPAYVTCADGSNGGQNAKTKRR